MPRTNCLLNPASCPARASLSCSSQPLRLYQEQGVLALERATDLSRVHVLQMPTGSGKTVVAADFIRRLFIKGYQILWVAKNWQLLGQAAEQILRRLPQHADALRRIGGDASCLAHLPTHSGRIYLTTLQTWSTRWPHLPLDLRHLSRLAIVWDEIHWGFLSTLGRKLMGAYLGRARMFGLSATPIIAEPARLVYSVRAEELGEGILAEPRVREIETGVDWRPELRHQDASPGSLRELANNDVRNQQIVQELVDGIHAGRYHRTIVFACNIDHAKILAEMIGQRGVPVAAVHTRVDRTQQNESIQAFRAGRLSVLVNVAMLAEGIDIPEIDSVFLCRPTFSYILLKQMIGRGSRRTPSKDFYWLVEFTDTLTRLREELLHARQVVPERESRRSAIPALRRHRESVGPRFANYTIPGYGAIPVALGQTFGVEIELTGPRGVPQHDSQWTRAAQIIIDRLSEVAHAPIRTRPLHYHARCAATKWRVTWDGSCGYEIISPILMNEDGFDELRRVCLGLSHLVHENPRLFKVNYRTGLHITLASRLDNDECLRGFLRRVQRLEPGLFTLVSPSRLCPFFDSRYSRRQGNEYCMPIRALGRAKSPYSAEYATSMRSRTLVSSNAWNCLVGRVPLAWVSFLKIEIA